jgi:hypothetical protein
VVGLFTGARSLAVEVHAQFQADFVSLEEFLDAMVIVKGLKKASQKLTLEELIRGMESVHDFDIGLGTELNLFSKRPQGIRPSNSNGDSRWPSGAATDWLVAAPH